MIRTIINQSIKPLPLCVTEMQKNLSMARRKDMDEEEYSPAGRRPQSGQGARDQATPNSKPRSTKVLGSGRILDHHFFYTVITSY